MEKIKYRFLLDVVYVHGSPTSPEEIEVEDWVPEVVWEIEVEATILYATCPQIEGRFVDYVDLHLPETIRKIDYETDTYSAEMAYDLAPEKVRNLLEELAVRGALDRERGRGREGR